MRTLLILALAACPCVVAQPAPATTKVAKIEEIFRLTKTDQIQKQMMSQIAALMKQQKATEQRQATGDGMQKVMEFIARKMSWDEMKTQFIKLYDETYSEEEISGILMFYQSTSGQAMLAKSPVLMANMMTLVQKRMMEIKPELDELIQKNVQK
jgi:hypothetical protein